MPSRSTRFASRHLRIVFYALMAGCATGASGGGGDDTSGGGDGGSKNDGGGAMDGGGGGGDGGPCVPTAQDEPDDNFRDTNCDGIDGDASRGVFVDAMA